MNYPKLAIHFPSRDICDTCFQHSNLLGAHRRKQNNIECAAVCEISAAQDEHDDVPFILDEPLSENDREDNENNIFGEETTGSVGEDFSVTAQQEYLENQVLKMSLHVESAWKMH
eukprot:5275880-Ditylum_brightwellii.AAC.1